MADPTREPARSTVDDKRGDTLTFGFQWGNEEPSLRRAVLQALGAASMCWSETPNGVFLSNVAVEVGNKLLAFIDAADAHRDCDPDTTTTLRRIREEFASYEDPTDPYD